MLENGNNEAASRALSSVRLACTTRGQPYPGVSLGIEELLAELMHLCAAEKLDFDQHVQVVRRTLGVQPITQNIQENNMPEEKQASTPEGLMLEEGVARDVWLPGGGRLQLTMRPSGDILVSGYHAGEARTSAWAQTLEAPARMWKVDVEVHGTISLNVLARNETQLDAWLGRSDIVEQALRYGDFEAEDDAGDYGYERADDGDLDSPDLDLTRTR